MNLTQFRHSSCLDHELPKSVVRVSAVNYGNLTIVRKKSVLQNTVMEGLEHGVEILKWQLIMRKNQNWNREKQL